MRLITTKSHVMINSTKQRREAKATKWKLFTPRSCPLRAGSAGEQCGTSKRSAKSETDGRLRIVSSAVRKTFRPTRTCRQFIESVPVLRSAITTRHSPSCHGRQPRRIHYLTMRLVDPQTSRRSTNERTVLQFHELDRRRRHRSHQQPASATCCLTANALLRHPSTVWLPVGASLRRSFEYRSKFARVARIVCNTWLSLRNTSCRVRRIAWRPHSREKSTCNPACWPSGRYSERLNRSNSIGVDLNSHTFLSR